MEFYDEGLLGGMFDFDGDGSLNPMEQTMEYMFLDEMSKEENAENPDFDRDFFKGLTE